MALITDQDHFAARVPGGEKKRGHLTRSIAFLLTSRLSDGKEGEKSEVNKKNLRAAAPLEREKKGGG